MGCSKRLSVYSMWEVEEMTNLLILMKPQPVYDMEHECWRWNNNQVVWWDSPISGQIVLHPKFNKLPYSPGDPFPCDDCGGSGQVRHSEVFHPPCPTCKGAKVKSVRHVERECDLCRLGEYWIEDPEQPCPKCNGTGTRYYWSISGSDSDAGSLD